MMMIIVAETLLSPEGGARKKSAKLRLRTMSESKRNVNRKVWDDDRRQNKQPNQRNVLRADDDAGARPQKVPESIEFRLESSALACLEPTDWEKENWESTEPATDNSESCLLLFPSNCCWFPVVLYATRRNVHVRVRVIFNVASSLWDERVGVVVVFSGTMRAR